MVQVYYNAMSEHILMRFRMTLDALLILSVLSLAMALTGGRLIKEENGGRRDERAGDIEPPLLSARQSADKNASRQRPTHLIHPMPHQSLSQTHPFQLPEALQPQLVKHPFLVGNIPPIPSVLGYGRPRSKSPLT